MKWFLTRVNIVVFGEVGLEFGEKTLCGHCPVGEEVFFFTSSGLVVKTCVYLFICPLERVFF